MKLNQYIGVAIGWTSIQLIILTAANILWNLVMPVINIPKVNFLQIISLYALFNLFKFNWVKSYNDNNLNSKIEK
jgi:hypothetical protein